MKKIYSALLLAACLTLPAQASLITTSFGYTADANTGIITNKDNTLQWLPFNIGNGVSLTDITNDINNNDGAILGLNVGEGWRLGTLSDLFNLANDVNPTSFFTFTQSNPSNILRNINAFDSGLLNEFTDFFGNSYNNSNLAANNPTQSSITSGTAIWDNGNFFTFYIDEGSNGQLSILDNTSFLNTFGESRIIDLYPYAVVREVNAPVSLGLLMLGAGLCFCRRKTNG